MATPTNTHRTETSTTHGRKWVPREACFPCVLGHRRFRRTANAFQTTCRTTSAFDLPPKARKWVPRVARYPCVSGQHRFRRTSMRSKLSCRTTISLRRPPKSRSGCHGKLASRACRATVDSAQHQMRSKESCRTTSTFDLPPKAPKWVPREACFPCVSGQHRFRATSMRSKQTCRTASAFDVPQSPEVGATGSSLPVRVGPPSIPPNIKCVPKNLVARHQPSIFPQSPNTYRAEAYLAPNSPSKRCYNRATERQIDLTRHPKMLPCINHSVTERFVLPNV